MKKNLLVFTFLFIGLLAKANTANLSLHSMAPSTISAGYELQFLVSSLPSGSCYGDFTVSFQRKLSTETFWSPITMTPVTGTSTSGITTLSKLYRTYQLEGYSYDYRVTVTFNPQAGGTGCNTAPNQVRTSSVVNVKTPKACFNILNPSTDVISSSHYGNQVVNKIGLSTGDVIIDATCSLYNSGYFVRVAKFDLENWFVMDDLYNDWVTGNFDPSNINLNDLIESNGKSFEHGAVYLVGVAVGPVWSATPPKFITINFFGRPAPVDQIKGDEMATNEIIVSPNPVTDNLTIDLNQTKALKVNIYDFSGKLIESYTPSTNESKIEINFSNYTSGTYLVQMDTDEGIKTEKVIKK
ncbi:exported hypothetical protein [Flavobacterium sp. 9AF]|uniref:T9SS type A sorting domain-containing protein n=1 Tax=Flavobacterium sp. 9AF TaxID=2653142 RepID=UPI0012EEED0D|nr:T9SS type A sorting domain-containing protein [Flavobacterium sp. 9AF]VXC27787.1 exported hypothetical protein [Flavobacterium sp. 9AF]